MGLGQCKKSTFLALTSLAVLLCGEASAALSADFETRLQQAEAAQEERREPLVGVESSIIALSPTAQLANGDGDISTIGKNWHRA